MKRTNAEKQIEEWIYHANAGKDNFELKKQIAIKHIREELRYFKRKNMEVTFDNVPNQIRLVLFNYNIDREEFNKLFL